MSGVVFQILIPTESYEKIQQNRKNLDQYQSKQKEFNREYVKNKLSMEKNLSDILSQYKINSVWCKCKSDKFQLVNFSIRSIELCEEILSVLKEFNIGAQYDSTVNVIPCSIHLQGEEEQLAEAKQLEETTWHQFLSSVRSRLTVAQVAENVRARAVLTFDFICLLLISTILCAIGLVTNSSICLISSMLISPMMGPVMAGTFGVVIQDKALQKTGVCNEVIGLGIAMLVGILFGFIISLKWFGKELPTSEMLQIGELPSLWIGTLVALLSGSAVALGVLSDNFTSLIGVAMSISIMPPAVNAGLFWSLALISYLSNSATTDYKMFYYENKALDLIVLGAVSLCFTFINIICIYVAGILVFKIKEVAPMVCRDKARRRFWSHDIKIARDYNRTIQNDEAKALLRLSTKFFLNSESNCLHHSVDLAKDNMKVGFLRPEYTWTCCSGKAAFQGLRLNKNVVKSEYGKLSQVLEHWDSCESARQTSRENCNETTPLLSSASCSNSSCFFTKTKKFTVTPCDTSSLI